MAAKLVVDLLAKLVAQMVFLPDLPRSTGKASTTTAKAAVTRSICKPEESYVHHLLTFCVYISPVIAQYFLNYRVRKQNVSQKMKDYIQSSTDSTELKVQPQCRSASMFECGCELVHNKLHGYESPCRVSFMTAIYSS
jgi:hypothetical protein